MTKHNTQLNVYNVDVYLDQINKYTSKDTELKFKMRAANFYKKLGGIKYLRRAIELYDESHEIECLIRGQNQPRAHNILVNLITCEKKLDKLKSLKKKKKGNN